MPTVNFVTCSVFFTTPGKAFNVFIGTSAVDLITYLVLQYSVRYVLDVFSDIAHHTQCANKNTAFCFIEYLLKKLINLNENSEQYC